MSLICRQLNAHLLHYKNTLQAPKKIVIDLDYLLLDSFVYGRIDEKVVIWVEDVFPVQFYDFLIKHLESNKVLKKFITRNYVALLTVLFTKYPVLYINSKDEAFKAASIFGTAQIVEFFIQKNFFIPENVVGYYEAILSRLNNPVEVLKVIQKNSNFPSFERTIVQANVLDAGIIFYRHATIIDYYIEKNYFTDLFLNGTALAYAIEPSNEAVALKILKKYPFISLNSFDKLEVNVLRLDAMFVLECVKKMSNDQQKRFISLKLFDRLLNHYPLRHDVLYRELLTFTNVLQDNKIGFPELFVQLQPYITSIRVIYFPLLKSLPSYNGIKIRSFDRDVNDDVLYLNIEAEIEQETLEVTVPNAVSLLRYEKYKSAALYFKEMSDEEQLTVFNKLFWEMVTPPEEALHIMFDATETKSLFKVWIQALGDLNQSTIYKLDKIVNNNVYSISLRNQAKAFADGMRASEKMILRKRKAHSISKQLRDQAADRQEAFVSSTLAKLAL